ncbi:N-6 DNA methylase [Mesorhizobium sp. ISC25]|uniref:Eco57I restriction-modification methylase domain-containing protein n=1 Tax=Mesorhizobium sp. ISC25 TaxID=3077335 RepID=UPI0035D96AE5
MARHLKRVADIGLTAVSIEGGLISPDQVAAIAATAPDQKTAADYGCPKGTNLRDEITRYFRIGQAHWQAFARLPTPNVIQTTTFVKCLLEEAFGFETLHGPNLHHRDGHTYRVTLEAKGGRVPVVVAAPMPDGEAFNKALPQLGDDHDGTIPRRSPGVLLQDWLNANPDFLWGMVFAGDRVRLMRDNASFTRPTYIEADLGAIFRDEMFADFTATWLLIHATRFGGENAPAVDCALERWREAGLRAGTAARERLGESVEEALLALGQGFLDVNPDLLAKLDENRISVQGWFEQLLRVVYRLIFLAVSEDRDLLHGPDASAESRDLYASAYGFGHMRGRSARRSAHDHHRDAWEGAKIVFRGLEGGEKLLGLPPLGSLFARGQTPDLDEAKLPNRAFMRAIFHLSWLIEDGRRVRINWRDMATEELGSVYEGLLELVPTREGNGRRFCFAGGDETRGNVRKKTGSYYTPDGLVQALLDSTLDPVLERAEAEGGVEAILALSVIDPACGSGHFLLGAARRIASRVALLRDSDDPDYSAAMRDVARRCIYGVDRNPMAIELAKVALWIETVEPGKPLGFLDPNLRCGDSLIGVFDISVLRDGIPDDAFKPLAGDDKEAASHYRTKNKREVKEREKVETGLGLVAGQKELSQAVAGLQSRPEDSLEDIEGKRRLFNSLMAQGGAAWKLKTACNLWTAAWFAPKSEIPTRGRELVPTSGQVSEYLRGITLYGPLLAEADRCAQRHRFFHWPVEFPDIMGKGGFDIVIGNPPWERVKLQEEEFFAAPAPDIANAKNAAARKKLIAALGETNPHLADEWNAAVRTAACESAYLRLSGRYPLGGVGDVNTYAIFADHFRQAINPNGRAGLILPNGLVTGYTYREFLRHLLSTKTLASFFGFENEDKLFKSVHNETKFGLLTVTGGRQKIEQPWFTAHIRQPEQITDPERRYALTIDEIEAINPNTLNLPAFRRARDAEITATIHKAAPVLVRKHPDGGEENPWQVKFKTLFHMAGASGDFLDHQDIAPIIVDRRGALAILTDGRQVYPLYEGKMFWHFDHRYGTYEDQTEKQANKGVLPHVPDAKHNDPRYRIEPRYWVEARLTHEALGEVCDHKWFFAWRDVGPSERSFVGTVIPKSGAGDTAYLLCPGRETESNIALTAILGSLVIDYAARQKSNRMKYFVVEQIPALSSEHLQANCSFLGIPPRAWLSARALELCYTNDEIAPFAHDLGRDHPPFRWQPERRILLQAEIDAAVLHLYGLSKNQAEWLLDSFTVLRKYEERDHNEFRTKRVVIEMYDEMAAAKLAGRAYQTLLNPVPADPSCCHPAISIPMSLVGAALAEGAWARQPQPQPGDTGAALAAILKTMDGPKPTRDVRLMAAFVLEPRLFVPFLTAAQATEWRRLVGAEADPLTGTVAAFATRNNAAWGAAVRNHRGNGRLIENLDDGTWAPGRGLDAIDTLSWPDGRAGFVLEALRSIDLGAAVNSLPDEIQRWIVDAAAA